MTLIEIMIVMVIMAMVATAATIGATHAMEQARIKTATTDSRTIAAAATLYQIEHGSCPTLAELAASRVFLVRSAGPDGKHGTEDDIDSRKKSR